MHTRRLGQTDLQVSEIGFGGWQLGNYDAWGGMPDSEALKLVAAALDAGCNLFDTAPNYARTNSERLLGQALLGRRENAIIVSKFGHRPDTDRADFSIDWFWESLHQTLTRLQSDYLDVMLLHSPPDNLLNGEAEIWDALRSAQEQGKIRHYGASVDTARQIKIIGDTSDAQVVEVLFNVLNQDTRHSLTAIAQNDLGMICKVPLDSGWLTGKYSANSQFEGVRNRWSKEDIARRAQSVEQVKAILQAERPLAQQALAYLLSYEQVSAVIPGVRSMEQLHANLGADGQRVSDQVKARLEQLWDELTSNGKQPLPW
jgi:aryl-alcohol dehydrogenase-like predicted oxidoreductase